MSVNDKPGSDRRTFLKGVTALATAGSLSAWRSAGAKQSTPDSNTGGTMNGYVAPQLERVRFAVIGTGNRGTTLLRLLLQISDADVAAVCDTDAESIANARNLLVDAGKQRVDEYTGDDYAYRRLLERDDIDAVIVATPWRWHAPMAIEAMRSGKHAFVEVPMATTIDDLWQMVETSESTRMHCMMLENVCYGRDEMMVLNMTRQGLFGELTHGEGAYIHDLRWQMKELERSTGSWRTYYHTTMRGNIYPTHGLGPIAQYMDINRGDRFDYITSVSSPAVGRAAYAKREFPADHERNSLAYVKGDMNSTLISTAQGRSILVQYDTTTARPYSRLNLVQGTNGAFAGYPNRIALEQVPDDIQSIYDDDYQRELDQWEADGAKEPKPRAPSFHDWDLGMEKWYARFDHPLWKSLHAEATKAGGHGGMDFVMLSRIVQCLRGGIAMDQDVYDGAAWSALFPLTHQSVVSRGKPQDVPDFTRNGWKNA